MVLCAVHRCSDADRSARAPPTRAHSICVGFGCVPPQSACRHCRLHCCRASLVVVHGCACTAEAGSAWLHLRRLCDADAAAAAGACELMVAVVADEDDARLAGEWLRRRDTRPERSALPQVTSVHGQVRILFSGTASYCLYISGHYKLDVRSANVDIVTQVDDPASRFLPSPVPRRGEVLPKISPGRRSWRVRS